MRDHEHCYHGTGEVLTTYPPSLREICCHCGEKRQRLMRMPRQTGEGHGPYFRKHHRQAEGKEGGDE